MLISITNYRKICKYIQNKFLISKYRYNETNFYLRMKRIFKKKTCKIINILTRNMINHKKYYENVYLSRSDPYC